MSNEEGAVDSPVKEVDSDVLHKFEELSRTVRRQQDTIEDLNVKLQHAEQAIQKLTDDNKAKDALLGMESEKLKDSEGKILALEATKAEVEEEKAHVIALLNESNEQRQELTKELERSREHKRVLVAELQKRRGMQSDDSTANPQIKEFHLPAADGWKELAMQGFREDTTDGSATPAGKNPNLEAIEHRAKRTASITDKVTSWFSSKPKEGEKEDEKSAIVSAEKPVVSDRPSLAPVENGNENSSANAGVPDPKFVKWLVDFYSEHNPPKVQSAADTAQKWIGREDVCMNLLEYKYGLRTSPPPELPQPLQMRLRAQSEEEASPPPDFEEEDFVVTEKTDFQTGQVVALTDDEQQAQEQEQQEQEPRDLGTPRDSE